MTLLHSSENGIETDFSYTKQPKMHSKRPYPGSNCIIPVSKIDEPNIGSRSRSPPKLLLLDEGRTDNRTNRECNGECERHPHRVLIARPHDLPSPLRQRTDEL